MREFPWGKKVEAQQTEWRERHNILPGQYGRQNRVARKYILPSDKWLHGTWDDTTFRCSLERYLEVAQIQPNRGKHNLKSSWTQCANIFFPFRYHSSMQQMLTSFLKRELDLDVSSIDAVELEYEAPGRLAPRHLLGEIGGKRGSGQTSPDVAILLTCSDGSCAIYLIENKYTEHHFYPCSAAKKTVNKEHRARGLNPNPDPRRCENMKGLIENPIGNCQQITWGRRYWSILANNMENDRLQGLPHCPAMKDGYQLLRQQALAQGIADMGLFDHVFSGVAYDERNHRLISCMKSLRMSDLRRDWPNIFKATSPVKFHCFSHQDFVSWVTRSHNAYIREWGKYIRARYGY